MKMLRYFTPVLWLLASLGASEAALAQSPSQAPQGGAVWGYKVKPGDKLVDIAKNFQKSPEDWKKLQERNGVADPKRLQPGQLLNIPVKELKQGDPVAQAALVHGEVQRLNAAGQPVATLASGDTLKMGDTVQTGARSTLTIRFADDSRMLVTEKSTVTMESLLNYGKTGMADTRVQVRQGGTDSQVTPQKGPASRYEVSTPAINLAVRGTGFRIQVDGATGATRTEVGEGLVAGSADGSQALIGRGYGLLAEPGKPLGPPQRLLPPPAVSDTPETVGKLPATWAWPPLEGALRYRVQLLAQVQGNEALIVDEQIDATQVQWDDLPDGNYVLRIRGVDASGLEGENAVRPLRLRTKPLPPTLTLPTDASVQRPGKLAFRWDAAPQAHTYRFQLAEDAAFQRIVAAVPDIGHSTPAVLLAVPAGTYFWRVASVTPAGDAGPYSEPFGLTVDVSAGPTR